MVGVRKKRVAGKSSLPVVWLPVDTRFFPDILAFGHVRGWAKIFLEIEMSLAVLVVIGACALLVLHFAGF